MITKFSTIRFFLSTIKIQISRYSICSMKLYCATAIFVDIDTRIIWLSRDLEGIIVFIGQHPFYIPSFFIFQTSMNKLKRWSDICMTTSILWAYLNLKVTSWWLNFSTSSTFSFSFQGICWWSYPSFERYSRQFLCKWQIHGFSGRSATLWRSKTFRYVGFFFRDQAHAFVVSKYEYYLPLFN